MAFEKECDIALLAISKNTGATDGDVYKALTQQGRELSREEITIITSILISNDFIRSNIERHDIEFLRGAEFYFMTDKGFEFLHTDSFVDRQGRWKLERKLNEQQSSLNAIELAIKPYTFLIALIGLGISIGALITAVYAAINRQ